MGIKTKESLCALFADDAGHPRKTSLKEFLAICGDELGVDVAARDLPETTDDDADDDDDESELLAFVKCFIVKATPARSLLSRAFFLSLQSPLLVCPVFLARSFEGRERPLEARRGETRRICFSLLRGDIERLARAFTY